MPPELWQERLLLLARNVMSACDHPHGDSSRPHSRRAIAASPPAALGEQAVRRITCDHCAEVHGIGG